MSIFKKNTLTVALVAGLGLAGVAGAYTTWTAGDLAPEKVATADATDDSVTMTETLQVRVDGTDFIVGRTTGFQVRVNLFGGESGSSSTFDGVPTVNAGAQLPAGWTVNIAAGGNGTNYLVVNVNPPSTDPVPGIVPGEIISIPGLTLAGVEELLTENGEISAETFFVDPVGANELGGSRNNVRLLMSGNPVVLDCDAESGDTSSRIDVADTSADGGFAAKTMFSSDGTLGGADTNTFDFGDLSASVDDAFGSFTYLATDEFTTTVTGDATSNFGAFDSIYLSGDNCGTSLVDGVIDGNTVTFEYTNADVGGDADGYNVALCGTVDGTTVIDDVNPINTSTTFSRPATTLTRTDSCGVLPLQYNGSVIEVYHLNPAGNNTAQSYLRVINRSGTGGTVHLDGIDDAGLSGDSEITFFLDKGQSMQINSDDLEAGNAGKGLTGAWGNGTGKWRAIVTAEFGGARVQAMNRNATDGTVTNLTDADGQGEQVLEAAFDNGNGF